MSGTSADGVDCAIVEVEGRGLQMKARPLSHAYEPFSAGLRKQILDVRQKGEVRLADLAEIGRRVTLAHVPAFQKACKAADVSADQIAAIAAHGQTLWHGPPSTIQYFDPSLLAYETGCAVVSDFRRADLAAGGQGAPLVPFADWILFRHPTKSRVILNIGGIANLTYLKAGGSIDEVIAFDTGPGNCISDWLMQGRGGVDVDGKLARGGTVDLQTLDLVISDHLGAFIEQPPPKSTDGPAMIEAFAAAIRETKQDQLADLLATAAAVTSVTVRRAALMATRESGREVDEILCAGGGVLNKAIMRELEVNLDCFPQARVGLLNDVFRTGAQVDLAAAREAIAFALLGAATLDGEPSNVPSATGAKRRVVLGSITPKPTPSL